MILVSVADPVRVQAGAMEHYTTALGAITAVAGLYVVVPVVADAYRRFRAPRTVTCPDNHEPAEVGVDALNAAANAALGRRDLRLLRCSRWAGAKQDCTRACLAELR